MKTLLGFFLFLLAVSFQGCDDSCRVENTYVYFEPVYSTPAQIKAAVSFNAAKELTSPGKIYTKDQVLYINEVGKGIHLFDNASPSHPKPLGFLNIPGNYDMAIIGNTLYADSFIDLVVFDITDVQKIKEVNRVEALFNHNNSMGYFSNTSQGIITDWKEVRTVSVTENNCSRMMQSWGGIYYDRGVALQLDAVSSFKSSTALSPTSVATGVAGSTSRFTIASNRLYTLDSYFLDVVDVSIPTQPVSKTEIQVSWMAETLFPLGETLFMGTRSGMFIFDLKNPDLPNQIGKYEHIYSCDPVVVEGDYAYVTLRNGNACQGTTNQLEIIDIKNPSSPSLLKTYPMTNPHGLGIDEGTLFICDGTDGLKVYDASDINALDSHQLAHYKDITALDIIPFKDIAMVVASDGLYQYDYSDVKKIKLLSKITIAKQ
jgi:hypothetical protein